MTVAPWRALGSAASWRRRGRIAILVVLLDLALFNAYQAIKTVNRWPDFACFYAFGKAGVTDGYQRIYDPAVQQSWVQQLFPGSPCVVVNPPPFAWLLVPLTALPYELALWIWTLSMIAALAVTSQVLAPDDGYTRVVFMGSWLAFLPAYLIFVSAPLAPLVALSVALAWRFVRQDRQVAAGLVLAIGLLKPTLTILVPIALLAAGYRRVFVVWFLTALAAVAASIAVLGPAGVTAYVALAAGLAADPYYLRWSLVQIVGGGAPWLAAVLCVGLATVWLSHRLRHGPAEVPIAIGVMASVLVNHHMTPGDLMLLLVPIWLLARSRGSLTRDVLCCLAWIAGWLGLLFPVLVILLAAGLILVLFVRSLRPERKDGLGMGELAGAPAR
jgi:hypothetical protein